MKYTKNNKINSQQNKINQNPGNVKNYRNNKQNQNHNINKFLNNTTTHSTTTYYEKGTNQNIQQIKIRQLQIL